MLLHLSLLALYAFSPSYAESSCHLVNSDVDQLVSKSNSYVHTEDGETLDMDNFNRHIHLTLFGFNLPWKVFIKAKEGSLYSMGSLSRSGNMQQCTNSTTTSLQGVFTFNRMEINYKSFEATFLRWKIVGTFFFSLKPSVNVMLVNSEYDCGPVNPISLATTENMEYVIRTEDNSWGAWLVTKAVHRALTSGDNTPILQNLLERFWVHFDVYFSWCQQF